MTLQEFSSLSGKELNTEYNVDGHVVILTNKEREHKAGAQTFFSGSVDGQTFEHRNVKGLCTFINGGKNESAPRTPRTPRTPRKTGTTPKHGFRLLNESELTAKSEVVFSAFLAKVHVFESLRADIETDRQKYGIVLDESAGNTELIKRVLVVDQFAQLERVKRNERLKSIYEGRLHVRAELYKSAKEEISEAICADRTPTKAQRDRLKKAKAEFEAFSNRVHVWDMDQ